MNEFSVLIPTLSFVSVLCLGAAVVGAVLSRRMPIRARLQNGGPGRMPAGQQAFRPPLFVRLLSTVGVAVSPKQPSGDLRMRLSRAGFQERSAVPLFLGIKVFLFLGGLVVFSLLSTAVDLSPSIRALAIVGGAALFFFLPNILVRLRTQKRYREIRRHLPDAVDLLEVCVSSGNGLDMAWNAVTDEIRPVSPLLADEMTLTNLEIHLGEERGSAIRHMAQRTGVQELSSLVAVLVQSERFGTSIAEALRVFAASMRELRSQRAEEEAERMAVKMIFPLVLFIFPVVLIVAVGPAGIRLVELFSGN